MPVQTKSKSEGKKNRKEINWMQIGVAAICLLVVVMCILSFAGFQNIFSGGHHQQSTQYIPAPVGYPLMLNVSLLSGDDIILRCVGMPIIAGYTVNNNKPLGSTGDGQKPYVLYPEEYNAISKGVLGMYPGNNVTVNVTSLNDYKATFTKSEIMDIIEKYPNNKYNSYDDINEGTVVTFPETYLDELYEEKDGNRRGVVTYKDSKKVVITPIADKIYIEFWGYIQQNQ